MPPRSRHFLFADATAVSSPLWHRIQARRELFLSRNSAAQFLGFAGNQLRRITGELGPGTHGSVAPNTSPSTATTPRPPCTASASTSTRPPCIELMRDGTITLPRPERDYLIECRTGTWTLPGFLAEATRLRERAEQSALSTRPCPNQSTTKPSQRSSRRSRSKPGPPAVNR